MRCASKEKSMSNSFELSLEVYKSFFDSLLDPVFIAEADTGTLLACNDAAAEMFGRPKSEMVGQHQRILHPPEEIEGDFSKTFPRHLKESGAVIETKIITKSGAIKNVSVKASTFLSAEKKLMVAVFKDITEKRELKYDLALKEKFLDFANDSIFVHDLEGNFLYVNEAAYKSRGYSKEEMLNMLLQDLDDAQNSSLLPQRISDLEEKGEAVFESAHLRKDGSIMPVEIHARLMDIDGKKIIISVARDITDTKSIKSKLEEQYNFLQAVMDAVPNPMFIKDTAGHYIGCNEALLDFLGVTRESVLGKTVHEVMPKDVADISQDADKDLFEHGGTQVYEVKVQRKDGAFRDMVFYKALFNDKYGNAAGVVATVVDISDFKHIEDALRESELRFREAFQSALIGMAIVSLEGKFLMVNSALCQMLGYTEEDLLAVTIDNVSHPEDIGEARVQRERLVSAEISSYRLKKRYLHRSGRLVWAMTGVSLIRDKEGRPLYFVKEIEDISERLWAEEQLKKSEIKFRALFENMRNAVAVYEAVEGGQDFVFKDFNKAAQRVEKITSDNVLNRSIKEVFPGVVDFGLFEVLKRVWRTGKPEFFPASFYQDSRISGWRENYIYKLASGEVVVIYDDVTERKIAEDEVKRKMHDLEIFHKVAVGRELKMQELKKRIKELESNK